MLSYRNYKLSNMIHVESLSIVTHSGKVKESKKNFEVENILPELEREGDKRKKQAADVARRKSEVQIQIKQEIRKKAKETMVKTHILRIQLVSP